MTAAAAPAANPLLDFQGLPRFDAIDAGHVTPAVDALLASARAAVDAVATDPHPPTWDNVVEPLATWKSPHSGALYPSRWRVLVPSARIAFEISPLLPDQELRTARSTGARKPPSSGIVFPQRPRHSTRPPASVACT